jgi:CBS domain-containing protein
MTSPRVYREDVEIAKREEPVREAARRMRERRVGALVVVDDGHRPVGVLTDRDLALRVLAEQRDPESTRVADVMTPHPVVIGEDTTTEAALALMKRHAPAFRRAPVVDRGGRLVGVLTVDDALRRIAAELAAIESVIRAETPFVMDGAVPS